MAHDDIEALERDLRLLKAFKTVVDIFKEYPQIRTLLLGHADMPALGQINEVEADRPRIIRISSFLRVKRWFKAKKNAWATASEISEGAGVSAASIKQILWITHSHRFEKKTSPMDGKSKQFRLRPDKQVQSGSEPE